MMRAVVLEALQQLSLDEVPVPEIADNELLVQTAAATICTSDLHDIAANPFGAPLPLTLGHEGDPLMEYVTALELAAHGQDQVIKVALITK